MLGFTKPCMTLHAFPSPHQHVSNAITALLNNATQANSSKSLTAADLLFPLQRPPSPPRVVLRVALNYSIHPDLACSHHSQRGTSHLHIPTQQ